MSHHELSIKVKPQCISVWKESWARRSARVTLLVDLGSSFPIVIDPQSGFWFLPGGGAEQNESVEEAAKREAAEELGVRIKINQIIKTFHVTLFSTETRERLRIHPFVVVQATCTEGQLKADYGPKRKILLVKKEECDNFLQDFDVPEEYECMKPHLYISKETIRSFFKR